MTVTTTAATVEAITTEGTAPGDAEGAVTRTDQPLVEGDLLVEDVSIDGMCGVY